MSEKNDIQGARRACYRLLKVRARSKKELQDRLKQKGFDDRVIERVVIALVRQNLLSDEAFAQWWVETRIEQPLGRQRLAAELFEKGIEKEIIDQVLDRFCAPLQEKDAIYKALQEKTKQFKGLSKEKMKQRAWSYFLRRGFSRDIVYDIINEL